MSVLVLVDWQNLFKACENKISLENVFEEILTMALKKRGAVADIRLFVPNFQTISSPWKLINQLQLKYGLSVEVCPVLREGAEMDKNNFKDTVDLAVYEWANKHIYPEIDPDLIVFVSGDGHFILAANEMKKRGKEIEFWVVDLNTASNTLLKNVPLTKIEPYVLTKTLAEKEENLFLSALVKAIDKTKKEELSTNDKERLNCLRKTMELLPSIQKKQTTAEETASATAQSIKEFLDVPKNDSLAILKTLIVLGAVRIHPAVTYQIKIDNSSLFFQWLCDWK